MGWYPKTNPQIRSKHPQTHKTKYLYKDFEEKKVKVNKSSYFLGFWGSVRIDLFGIQ